MVKILLIDDDPSIQQTYTKFLKDEGYTVYQALSAEQATEILITCPVDLILLDISMPEVNGILMKEVIDAYDADIRVVVASAYPLSQQRRRVLKADDYFDKSHGIEWLLVIIRRVLGNNNLSQNSGTEERRLTQSS